MNDVASNALNFKAMIKENKKEQKKKIIIFLIFSAKKLTKQVERLQSQLSEEKSRNRELSAQLTEAADYKVLYVLIINTYIYTKELFKSYHVKPFSVILSI